MYVYDGSVRVPIKSTRVTTQLMKNRFHVTVDTDGLGKPKNGKKFRVRITDAHDKSEEFDQN